MIFFTFDRDDSAHMCDLTGMFAGCSAMLVGGSPSLKDHDLSVLEQRGLVTFAMNNTGALFRPTCMACCDNPQCFDLSILKDPTVMKFGLLGHAKAKVRTDSETRFQDLPNMFFYPSKAEDRDSAFGTPRYSLDWKRNTMFVSIEIMISLGIRTIVLAGSDFGSSKDGRDYAHGSSLDDREKIWNSTLYKYEAFDLRKLKNRFDELGVELIDASDRSKISGDLGPYRHMTLEEGVKHCLRGYDPAPAAPGELPHCSRLYSRKFVDNVVAHRYSVIKDEDVIKDIDNVAMTAVPPGVASADDQNARNPGP